MKRYTVKTPRAMQALARAIGTHVRRSPGSRTRATVIGLEGELGAGKTVFANGFATAFHVKRRMVSPTFLIVRSYPLSIRRHQSLVNSHPFSRLYHIDFYRITRVSELRAVAFHEIMKHPHHLVLIEWANRFPHLLPKNAIRVQIRDGVRPHERRVIVRGL